MYTYTRVHKQICVNTYVLYTQICTCIHIDILTYKPWNLKEDHVKEGSGPPGGKKTRGGLWEWIWASSSDKHDENSIIKPLSPMLTKILIKNLKTQLRYKMFQFKLKLAWVFSKILAKIMYFLLGSPQLSSCLIFQTLEADNLKEITVAYAGPFALDQSCFHCHQWHCWEADELPQSWGLLGHSIVVQQVPKECSGNGIHHWPSSPSEGRNMVSVLQTFCCVSQSSTSWQVWILNCPKKGKRKWLKKGWNWNQTRIKKERNSCVLESKSQRQNFYL